LVQGEENITFITGCFLQNVNLGTQLGSKGVHLRL
jgi:hypothetical protein